MGPTLRTDRLELRPLHGDDHAALLAHWSHPQVRHFLFDDKPPSHEQVTEIISAAERDFATAGYGVWALRRAGSADTLIGTAGLRLLEDVPEGDPHAGDVEIIYSLDPDHWGSGLAREAAATVLAFAFQELALDRVVAEIDEGNAASAALARRLGMEPEDTVPGLLGPMVHYVAERETMSP